VEFGFLCTTPAILREMTCMTTGVIHELSQAAELKADARG